MSELTREELRSYADVLEDSSDGLAIRLCDTALAYLDRAERAEVELGHALQEWAKQRRRAEIAEAERDALKATVARLEKYEHLWMARHADIDNSKLVEHPDE